MKRAPLYLGAVLVGLVVLAALGSLVWTPYDPAAVVALAAGGGVPLGLIAGMSDGRYAQGRRGAWLSEALMRAVDVLYAFPALLLAILLAAAVGASTATAMVAIGVATIPAFARIARAATLTVMTPSSGIGSCSTKHEPPAR